MKATYDRNGLFFWSFALSNINQERDRYGYIRAWLSASIFDYATHRPRASGYSESPTKPVNFIEKTG